MCYEKVDLASQLFSIPRKEGRKQFTFKWTGQHLFVALPQGYVHSPTLCCIQLYMDYLSIPENVTLIHYKNDTADQAEGGNLTSTLEALTGDMNSRG